VWRGEALRSAGTVEGHLDTLAEEQEHPRRLIIVVVGREMEP
jgi:hypothetical protein